MMELSVWEQGEQIGTVTAQQDGLFYIFICKISKHAEQLRRIYVNETTPRIPRHPPAQTPPAPL